MRLRQRQAGMTLIGWMLILLLIGAVVFVLLKLIPIYIDGFQVGDVVKSFRHDPQAAAATPAEIERMVLKRLDINMVTDVKRDDISVTKTGNSITVEINYEVRQHMFGNIDVVVSFDKRAEIPLGPS